MGLVSLVALTGCGGGGNDAPPLSRAAFIKKANAICRGAQVERSKSVKTVIAEASDASADKEAKVGTEALLTPVRTMTAEIGELVPMKSQTRQVEALLAAFEKAADQVEEQPTSHQTPVAFAQADELARRYGLVECVI
jgi:hypothetical protein